MTVLNLCWGAMTIIVPLIVLDVLDEGEAWVGIAFAASGISGMISALDLRPARHARPGAADAGRSRCC